MEALELVRLAQVVEEDRPSDFGRLLLLVLDRALIVAVYDAAMTEEERKLDIWWYSWDEQSFWSLIEDVGNHESGQMAVRNILEFAAKEAFEPSELIYA